MHICTHLFFPIGWRGGWHVCYRVAVSRNSSQFASVYGKCWVLNFLCMGLMLSLIVYNTFPPSFHIITHDVITYNAVCYWTERYTPHASKCRCDLWYIKKKILRFPKLAHLLSKLIFAHHLCSSLSSAFPFSQFVGFMQKIVWQERGEKITAQLIGYSLAKQEVGLSLASTGTEIH